METYTKRSVTPEAAHDGHSIGELLRELREETVTLAKQEVALAKAEMKEKVSKFGRNAAYFAIGAVLGVIGLMFLFIAAMRGLSVALVNLGVDPSIAVWLSPLILGAVVALIGWMLISKAKHAFKEEKLIPEKTIQSLKEETSWTRTKIKEV